MTVAAIGRGVDKGKRQRGELRAALRDLAGCERRLLRQVGEPAAVRYRPGYDLLLMGCQSVKRIALQLTRAIDEREQVPMAEVNRESERSAAYFKRGTAKLEGSMRANRDLSVESGGRDESKIEPRLSGFASELVLRKSTGIEVRCWSVDEWPFVLKEWGVYIGRTDLLGLSTAGVRGRALPRGVQAARRVRLSRRAAGAWHAVLENGRQRRASSPTRPSTSGTSVATKRQRNATGCRTYGGLHASWARASRMPSVSPTPTGATCTRRTCPSTRTEACHDGGPLDLRRGTKCGPSGVVPGHGPGTRAKCFALCATKSTSPKTTPRTTRPAHGRSAATF